MIYAALEDAGRYLGIHKNLDVALRFILEGGLDKLTLGRNEIAGDAVYANLRDLQTKPREQVPFEAHRRYTDIHVTLTGCEEIATAKLAGQTLTQANEEGDCYLYDAQAETVTTMTPGHLLITFTEDLHRPAVQAADDPHVKKVIFKVLVD